MTAKTLTARSLSPSWRRLLCIVVLCSGSQLAQAADKATDDFNLGVSLFKSERYETASDTLTEFLKNFPEHPRANTARLYLALSLNSLEKYGPAREQFASFLKNESDGRNAAEARYRLAECSYFLRDHTVAIAQFNDYLTKHSGHPLNDWAKLFLGDCLVATEQWEQAESTLRPLLNAGAAPEIRTDARFSLGRALEGLKKGAEAVELYKPLATSAEPGLAPRALARIGAIEYGAGHFEEAAGAYEQLLQKFPESPQVASASLGAGMSRFKLKQFEAALPKLRAVPKDHSGAGQAVMMAAVALRELGRVDDARTEFAEALKAAGDTKLAAEILFQQAQLEREADSVAVAAQIYEDIADRWPQDERTPDCLFNAAELNLDADKPDKSARLWQRLAGDFRELASQPKQQVLLGRIHLALKEPDKAIPVLTRAAGKAVDPDDRTSIVGRYYLARACYEAGRHDQVVVHVSLLEDALKAEANADLRGAFALATISSLEQKDYESVLKYSAAFLPHAKDPRQKTDVSAARAIALSATQKTGEAVTFLRQLTKDAPEDPSTWTAVLQSAEAALQQKNATHAESLFQLAAANTKVPTVREAGLAGTAWSQFELKKYADAAQSFGTVIHEFPNSEDAAQLLHMQARCIQALGDGTKSAEAWSSVFVALTKDQGPAAGGAEASVPLKYAFDAGRQAAREWQKAGKPELADQAWMALDRQFPNAEDAAAVLDEWAWMHASAERFAKSDEIHQQLLNRFPDSPFAGQARLSLAESALEAGKVDEAGREFEAIAGHARYGSAEKERALFHLVELHVASRNWQQAVSAADTFLTSHADSPLLPQVRLLAGDALQQSGDFQRSIELLTVLREEIQAGKVSREEPWLDRVWIVLAECQLALKKYDQIDQLESELRTRSPKSAFAFQMHHIQGRRWKQQAPPDFARAREYFARVTADPAADRTETAANCQFLIGETYAMETLLKEAVPEYMKVYFDPTASDELRAQALYQAGLCEAQLNRTRAAVKDLEDLIRDFPDSPLVPRAREELEKLRSKDSSP